MKSKIKWLLLMLLAISIVGFGSNDAIRLPWPPAIGASAQYKVVNVLTTPFGSKVTFEWMTTETVKGVADGKITTETQSTEPLEKTDGPTGCPVKLGGPNGEIICAANGSYLPSQENEGSMAARFGNMNALVLPEKPIRIGESWRHEIKADVKTGAWPAKSTYKLLGKERIDNWDAYKIAVDYHETTGDEWEQLSATGIKWISVEDGMLVQEELQVKAPYGVEALHIKRHSKRIKNIKI